MYEVCADLEIQHNKKEILMRRSGFTMIELIFVIVILGILASVAIPKLAATRDDAKVSKALNELAMIKGDMATYYTSHGTYTAAKVADVTNVPLYTNTGCTGNPVTSIASGRTYYYCTQKTGSTNEAIVKIQPNDTKGALTISKVNATGNIGKQIQTLTSFDKIATGVAENMGGSKVTY